MSSQRDIREAALKRFFFRPPPGLAMLWAIAVVLALPQTRSISVTLLLGQGYPLIAAQLGLLVVASLLALRRIVRTRIGPWEAIEVRSYFRLCLGLLACDLLYLGGYQLLLWLRPDESWRRLLLYFAAATVSYPILGVLACALGLLIDHGRALRVLTSRYRPATSPGLVDLTNDHGRSAQLIPRSAIAAGIVLMLLGLIAASAALGAGP